MEFKNSCPCYVCEERRNMSSNRPEPTDRRETVPTSECSNTVKQDGGEGSGNCRDAIDAARYRKLKADDVDVYFNRTGTSCQSFDLDDVLDADGQEPKPMTEGEFKFITSEALRILAEKVTNKP